jgi:hypothetical protein
MSPAVRVKMTEQQFQDAIVRRAEYCQYVCYHTYDSRRSQAGFPDLVLVRVWPRPQLIFAELKVGRNKLRLEQEQWRDILTAIAAVTPNVSYHLWRPENWDEIERVITGPTRDELDAIKWQQQNPELYGRSSEEAGDAEVLSQRHSEIRRQGLPDGPAQGVDVPP